MLCQAICQKKPRQSLIIMDEIAEFAPVAWGDSTPFSAQFLLL
jgi:hypothetical protein